KKVFLAFYNQCASGNLFRTVFTCEDSWHETRSEVSKVTVAILLRRCETILEKFLTDENSIGEHPLPSVRIEETVYVLQELARLSIHSDAAAVLQLPPSIIEILKKNNNIRRAHLYVLFPSFCELVVSRFVPQWSCFLTIFVYNFS
ncbi:hypothetical protein BHM03_00043214, partial [Ensete ventricosum]